MAARVVHLVFTGLAVPGSQVGQQICRRWTGPSGTALARQCVGEAVSSEVTAVASRRFRRSHSLLDVTRATSSASTTIQSPPYERSLRTSGAPPSGSPAWISEDERSPRDARSSSECRSSCMSVSVTSAEVRARVRKDSLKILDDSGIEPARVYVYCITGSEEDL